ncbi:MAG: hypothetical protein JNK64_04830, partial [Myxococcales bacterium]|nr:hypothetical protein [Myxococcales bacterium]
MTASLRPLPDRERGQIELAAGAGEPLAIGPLAIDRLALAAGDAIEDGELSRWQRRRTRLAAVRAHVDATALAEALAARRPALAAIGVTELTVTTDDVVAVTARVADGLASADVSFQIGLCASGRMLRAIVGAIRVHGHLPTPAPLVVQRLIDAVLGDDRGDADPIRRAGLCEWVIDVAGLATWRLLPPAGWRLPALDQVRVVGLTIAGGAVTIELGAEGDPPTPPPAVQAWTVAHAAMASADELLRQGLLEDAMRGYRALLAAAGPEQPALLERILAITSARPTWFVDGRELARQALGRWPEFAAAHAALASIALAEGDTREAAARLATVAQLGSRQGDRAGATAAALAAARLYRVIEPAAATALYQRALTLSPGLVEAEDALIERLTDERRWRELVALHDARGARRQDEARAAAWAEAARLAADELGDLDAARGLVGRALAAAPIAAAHLAAGR